MKKAFFLIAFFFSVVCFAAPPPDSPIAFPVEDVGFFQSPEVTVDFCFEAQEVSFAYIGNSYNLFLSTDLSEFATNYDYSNRLCSFQLNKQNTNFGYPFGADY